MWTVGIIRGQRFQPLEGAPAFAREAQAATWAQRQLASNRLHLTPGRDFLTWRPADLAA